MKPNTLFAIIFPLTISTSVAQDCSVEMQSIKGTYTGECKKGKAEGKGIAIGVDTFSGQFKNGLPHGTGKYIFANGDWYEGNWVKGQKSGEGKMVYKINTGDSAVTGFWKKDVYTGLYEKPFIIHSRALNISGLELKMANKSKMEVQLLLNSITGDKLTSLRSTRPNVKPVISKFEVSRGDHGRTFETHEYSRNVYTFENVVFPFRATFTVNGSDAFEIEIFEAGRWTVEINTSY